MIKKKYNMIIAGKERIFSTVRLLKSRTGSGYILPKEEVKRLSIITCKDICFSNEIIELEELEFLRSTFDLKQTEVAKGIGVDESTFSKWKSLKKEKKFNKMESTAIKLFFIDKFIIKIETGHFRDNESLGNIFLHELIYNLKKHSKLDFSDIKIFQKKYIETYLSLELSANFSEVTLSDLIPELSNLKKISSGYIEDLEKCENNYLEDLTESYWQSLDLAV